MRRVDERVRPPGRLVRRADVRIVVAEVLGDRVDDLVGALGAAGAVEEREPPVERREPGAHGRDVEQRCAHSTLQEYTGGAVRDAPTKQSRSAFARSLGDRRLVGPRLERHLAVEGGLDERKRPSESRLVTVPRTDALDVRVIPARTQW